MSKQTLTLQNQEIYHYQSYNNQNNETVLFVHGNMSSGVHFEPLVEHFTDYHVLIPDLRGFGDSSYKKPLESLEDLADDLMDFLYQLNIDKVHLVGWSTGGGIGLKFASKYPAHIQSLTLIESASYRGYPIYKKDANNKPTKELYTDKDAMANDPVQVLPAKMAMDNKNAELMKQIWQMAIYNVKTPDQQTFEKNISETLKQRNLIDIDWALMTFNMSHTSNGVSTGDGSIEDVQCPVLSIYGHKDLVIPRPMFDETVNALQNVITQEYPEGSHSPITDFPKILSDHIQTFLKTH